MSRNPWGSPAAAAPKLHDVMDEELAAKLQREEEEQFEMEIAGRFGDDRQVGWCFVEVPCSSDCDNYGVMSVVQQEISIDECPPCGDSGDDPDYTFALELQAQEAEEYDRLRRQEESSMERIRVIQQEHPKREEIRQTLQRFYHSEGNLSGLMTEEITEGSGRLSQSTSSFADDLDDDANEPQRLSVVPHAAHQPVAAGHVERVHLRDLEIHRGIYIDGDAIGLPRRKQNSLSSTLKHADRKQRSQYNNHHHHRSKTLPEQNSESV
ncbi:hypothetical protein FI667_g2468, partial [Globisporangium splendens]